MSNAREETTRYGIGEWYGSPIEDISAEDKARYAKLRGKSKETCPFRPDRAPCGKPGGVCSLGLYSCTKTGRVSLGPDLVTLCPLRFWQDYHVFRAVGKKLLGTNTPILIKQAGFAEAMSDINRSLTERICN